MYFCINLFFVLICNAVYVFFDLIYILPDFPFLEKLELTKIIYLAPDDPNIALYLANILFAVNLFVPLTISK